MNTNDIYFLYAPLVCLLCLLCVLEFRTGLIRNVHLLPAVLYFLAVGTLWSSSPWYYHLAGFTFVLLFFMSFPIVLAKAFPSSNTLVMPGGVVKLFSVVGSALGLKLGIVFTVISTFLLFHVFVLSHFLFKGRISIHRVSGCLYALVALGITFAVNFAL